MNLRKSKGFTLIELLAVIAIIAILTAIIYSSFGGAQAASRDKKRVADISLIQLSLEAYFNHYGYYPISTTTLATSGFLVSYPAPPNGGPNNPNYGYNYAPLTQVGSASTICTSYQLWTTFEASNQYLSSRKGFNSTPGNLPSGMYECGNNGQTIDASKSTNSSVYDVMPQ